MKNPADAGGSLMDRQPFCAFVATVLDGPTRRR